MPRKITKPVNVKLARPKDCNRLRETNAELLAALKAYHAEAVRHGWDDHHNEPVMRLDGISLETTRAGHAAIARAEGEDR